MLIYCRPETWCGLKQANSLSLAQKRQPMTVRQCYGKRKVACQLFGPLLFRNISIKAFLGLFVNSKSLLEIFRTLHVENLSCYTICKSTGYTRKKLLYRDLPSRLHEHFIGNFLDAMNISYTLFQQPACAVSNPHGLMTIMCRLVDLTYCGLPLGCRIHSVANTENLSV